MIIYKITNKINGKVYIGQTIRTLEERTSEHLRRCEMVIDKALRKYGVQNFTIEQIDGAHTMEELNQKEIYWIAKYNSIVPNGYNQCNGGSNTCGFHHREESRAKMSIKRATMYLGEKNPFFGKTHSEASKKKMSEARKGMAHLTTEQVANLRKSHRTIKVLNVETGEIFNSVKEAAIKYGLKDTHITRVCKGKRKTTGGFHRCYEESQ